MDNEMRQVARATDLLCLECDREWSDPRERWRMYATAEDEPDVGLYCPTCAAFEFDA